MRGMCKGIFHLRSLDNGILGSEDLFLQIPIIAIKKEKHYRYSHTFPSSKGTQYVATLFWHRRHSLLCRLSSLFFHARPSLSKSKCEHGEQPAQSWSHRVRKMAGKRWRHSLLISSLPMLPCPETMAVILLSPIRVNICLIQSFRQRIFLPPRPILDPFNRVFGCPPVPRCMRTSAQVQYATIPSPDTTPTNRRKKGFPK